MHYGDREHIEENRLKIVVYKHGTPEDGVFDYRVTSINECRYFPTYLLSKILVEPKYYLADLLKDKKEESWYLIEMRSVDGYSRYEIMFIMDVSEDGDEFLRLH